MKQLGERLRDLLGWSRRVEMPAPPRRRGAVDHVILLDGTMSTLAPGHETNIGRIFRLLGQRRGAQVALYYEAGPQWRGWRDLREVATGAGVEAQIRRAYGWLASHYRPGDRIFLFGYSRGAFAVRSLAGIIDRVGLLTAADATERNVGLAWRYYKASDPRPAMQTFRRRFCHADVTVEFIGVFDTVKALGLRLPLLWMWTEGSHRFHSHALGPVVRRGAHALALHETRAVFAPILWETDGAGGPVGDGAVGGGIAGDRIEQVWFPGAHGDVGGHLGGFEAARPRANLSLLWMLDRAEAAGLPLPADWRAGIAADAGAPSVGTWRGWGCLFLLRSRRPALRDPSERLHPAAATQAGRGGLTVRWWVRRSG